jgi:hypothetical protein
LWGFGAGFGVDFGVDLDRGGWLEVVVCVQVDLDGSRWIVAMSIAAKSAAITKRMATRPTAVPLLDLRVRQSIRASTCAFDSAAPVAGAREVDV